jgi:hypothetical protein
MSNFLSEATKMKSKKTNRQPLDSAKKAERKRDNTQTQRQVRGKREEKIKSGNVKGEVYAVRNKKGDVELVDKQSLRADHTILLDADKASLSTLKKFVGDKGFRNTDTSIRLFGLQQDAGGEKEGKKEKKESKEKKGGKQTSAAAAFNPPPQKIPASKKASKKDTYATSHDATAMESGIAFAVNSALGLSPDQMVKKGLIDKKDVDDKTIDRILNLVRPDGDQWLKLNALLRELMLASEAQIVFIKILSSTLTPEQKLPYKQYFDQLDASLELAASIKAIRDEGIAFKDDPKNKF